MPDSCAKMQEILSRVKCIQHPAPPPINITGDDEWPVESIQAVKKAADNILKYHANWEGADEEPEWYPASNFMYSPHASKDFHHKYPNQPGPPAKLPAWLEAFKHEREDYDELAGNNKEKLHAQV